MILQGRMLVPLRFVSEAMGARVDWDNAMRVVYITSGEVSQPVPPPVVAPPVAQPPAPTSTVVEVSGRIDAVTARAVVLEDGQAYALADDAQFYLNGRAVPRQRLREGMEVTLRFSDANQVVEVQAQGLVGQPPSGPAAVRISSLTHNATGGLSTGDTITVQLRGTPGGQAFFDIFGVAASVPMTEVATGLYQGSYVMRAGNTVSDAAIFGRLRVGGRDAPIARADAPVTIDTTGPVIVQRFPERDRQVNNARPNIVIVFSDAGSGIDPSRTRLIVEGQDVTTRVTVTDTAITYNPHEPLSGRVNVRVILRDRAGNVTDERYSFTIGDSSALGIRSVTLNPTAPLRAGDGEVLTVTMAGEPAGSATFWIEGVTQPIAMAELRDRPGTYVGSYTAGSSSVANARVIVQLTRGNTVHRSEASSRLAIVPSGRVPAPVIVSPAGGTRLGTPMVIRGMATPGYRVVVQVDYAGNVALFRLEGTYGRVTTTADTSGQWSVTFSQAPRFASTELTITAVAIDPLGRRSDPAVVRRLRRGRHRRNPQQTRGAGTLPAPRPVGSRLAYQRHDLTLIRKHGRLLAQPRRR